MHPLLRSDSYKVGHHLMYPQDTKNIHSYFESRGGEFPEIKFFGLQYYLLKYLSKPITHQDVMEAEALYEKHLWKGAFNSEGFHNIVTKHKGYLPLSIKSVDEGTVLPISNMLFNIMVTDPDFYWVGQWIEPILSKIWYPTTVASMSYHTKKILIKYLLDTGCSLELIDFMLHDFGERSTSSPESAELASAAHLLNFRGTDSFGSAISLIDEYYGRMPDEWFAKSVIASEHSIMTAEGKQGEENVFVRLLKFSGILSVVIDSYDYKNFMNVIVPKYQVEILNRNAPCVLRPDSVSPEHPTPKEVCLYLLESLEKTFDSSKNSAGYKALSGPVRLLWGDGINYVGIEEILAYLKEHGWASSNMACFGEGSGLVQDITRDTCKFAMKSSAIQVGYDWRDVKKETYGKESKAGRLKLIHEDGQYKTVGIHHPGKDFLKIRYYNGELYNLTSFGEILSKS